MAYLIHQLVDLVAVSQLEELVVAPFAGLALHFGLVDFSSGLQRSSRLEGWDGGTDSCSFG